MINDDKDKISIYEPFELDKSQLTNLMNASYRRSFNSISLADISNKRDSDKNLLKIKFNSDKEICESSNENMKSVNINENEKLEELPKIIKRIRNNYIFNSKKDMVSYIYRF